MLSTDEGALINKMHDDFIKKYLDLINCEIHTLSINYISELQKNHIETIAWDTIDLYLKRKINLSPHAILEKFLSERGAGVCYELNGAFYHLLESLGFEVHLVSVHVHGHNNNVFNFKIDTHVAIILKFNEKLYLVDVGWGDSYRKPVPLEKNIIFSDNTGKYKLSFKKNLGKYELEKFCNDAWRRQYSFSLEKRELDSFYENLNIIYHDPAHEIHRQLNCDKPNKNGAFYLKNDEFTIKEGDKIEKNSFENYGGIQNILIKFFGIDRAFVVKHFK